MPAAETPRIRTVVIGAAGRDFHDFNVVYRGDERHEVVAFTATQIPNIDGRRYPAALAGPLYPEGIPIHPEEDLEELIRKEGIRLAAFSYSDVSHEHVMHLASRALAAGADYLLLGPKHTAIESRVPVVSVCAARTGSGKSQTSRRVAALLQEMGRRVVVVRHPMPYGDLTDQICQRYASYDDLDRYQCTIEEREEYEPHIDAGRIVYAGVDYERILRDAEKEADVVLWDGGNNDIPFYRSGLHIVLVDPHRPGHEITYYPGETNLRMANVVIVGKSDSARPEGIDEVVANARRVNPGARLIRADSVVGVENETVIRGKRVLVVEDGPTLTHGEMAYGAGVVAAQRFGAGEIIDPRPFAVGSIIETYAKYPTTGNVLPAMGYGSGQTAELEETINNSDAELVIAATPIDLSRIVNVRLPMDRVRYELQPIGRPTLADVLTARFGTQQ